MGFFKNKKPTEKVSLPWKNVESVDQLMEIAKTTFDKPVLLFKHSTRCSISAMALNSFERNWSSGNELCNLYFVDLLNYRDVSNKIAEITGITHQSPQVIVLKGSEIIYDASHSAIDARRIESRLKKA